MVLIHHVRELALIKEVREPYDSAHIATALVPHAEGPAKEWADMARLFTQSALEALRRAGAETRDIYDVLNVASIDEQRELFAKTPAKKFLIDGGEKTLASVGFTLATATAYLRYLPRGDAFSVRDWIRRGRGWLFLPFTDAQIAAVQPLFRVVTYLAISEALSLPARDNKLWFIIDEFDALGKLEKLDDAMQRMRKHGGRMLLGLQTVNKPRTIYGAGIADAILENPRNRLLMGCSSGSEGRGTREWASRLIGEAWVRRTVHSTNTSSGMGWNRGGESSNRGASSSNSEQIAKEDVVMPGDFEKLKPGEGFLKFATRPEWMRLTCPYLDPPERTTTFVPINPEHGEQA